MGREARDERGIEARGRRAIRLGRIIDVRLVDDEDSPYVQLRLTKAVKAGQQLFTDYGSKYPYEAHKFTR